MHRIIYISIILWFNIIQAQQIKISGKVTDTTGTPVVFANIMAEVVNNTQNKPPVFTMTDENGKYKINLLKKYAYQLSVLSMGYDKYVFKVDSLSGDLVKNIVLKQASNQLDEVVITADMPVKVTQDSIVYKTDKFKTGEERKLKDVLKKLPGVEVGKNGQVTVMGKKVSKVLVEGKEFFGGGTKLAVENIPADAVDKVTAVDDYNSVGFMRGLTDEQKMIINIKLKEGKKRFVFGDLVAGAALEEKYTAKSNLFYYSPKTNISFIGNLNNIGESPMTIDDYLRFNGSNFDLFKMRSSFKSFKAISNLIMPQDFTYKKDLFGAAMWQQDIGTKQEFNTYVIAGQNATDFYQQNTNLYLDNNLFEQRNTAKNSSGLTSIAQIHYRYKPGVFNYFDVTINGNWQDMDYHRNIQSVVNQDNTFVLYDKNLTGKELHGNIAWHRKINKKNTLRILSDISYVEQTPNENWQTDKQILNTVLPLDNAGQYNIRQNFFKRQYAWNNEIKHYWLFQSKQHIYSSIGSNLLWQDFLSNTYQIKEHNQINDFSIAGFDNDANIQLFDYYGGLQYKIKLGKWIFKTGVFAHKYYWNILQNDKKNSSHWKILPELSIRNNTSFSKQLRFTYKLTNSIPESIKFLKHYYLTGFSSVAKGNPGLEDALLHDFSFRYSNYSFASDFQYYITVNYKRKTASVKSKIQYEGINTYSMPVMSYLPENSLNLILYFKRDIKKMYIKIRPSLFYNDYHQNLQNNWKSITSISQSYDIGIGSYFKKWPNFDAGIQWKYNKQKINGDTQNSQNLIPYVKLEYDFLKSFIFKSDYQYIRNTDYLDNVSTYQDASLSLFYQKENNPWGFEFKIDNLFNTKYKISTFYSDYQIATQNIYRQARLVLFKVSYKL